MLRRAARFLLRLLRLESQRLAPRDRIPWACCTKTAQSPASPLGQEVIRLRGAAAQTRAAQAAAGASCCRRRHSRAAGASSACMQAGAALEAVSLLHTRNALCFQHAIVAIVHTDKQPHLGSHTLTARKAGGGDRLGKAPQQTLV